MKHQSRKKSTSWESVSSWYDQLVGKKGQHYHETIIMPNVLRLLELKGGNKILDLGCGQGILSRCLPKGVDYMGVDLSKDLIKKAQKYNKKADFQFVHADMTREVHLKEKEFTHAAFILSLQNMEDGKIAIQNASEHLTEDGKLILVLNHPCFRIPRQSSWQIDPQQKIQYRRLNRYLSKQKIPIQMKPSEGDKHLTYSFHHSLSSYSDWLSKAGFQILKIEEWSSDKKSTGKNAAMENRARSEFPLFLSIFAKKQ